MKVLVLTNETYKDFISKLVFDANAKHNVHAWYEDKPYPFEEIDGRYDVGISFMYTHKVPAKEVNSHPWFNFHPAPLPEYKGRDLCYHAIMNGEKEFGATLHYMDENFDTGDIIEVMPFPLLGHLFAQALSESAIYQAKVLFTKYLPLILEGREFPRIPNRGGTYYKKGEIVEEIKLKTDEPFAEWVRAVSFPSKGFHPRIDIGGVKYKIIREE